MGGTRSSTTEQKTEPWIGQQAYLDELFGSAADLFHENKPNLYGGRWTADFADPEKAAQKGLLDYSSGAGGDYTKSALDASKFGLTAMDSASNPYLSNYIKAATQPIFQNLNENAIPQARSDANLAGAYGGTRHGIVEGLATQGAQQQAANVGATLASDAYGKGLDTYTKTLSMAPDVFKLGASPALLAGQVGAQQRELSQAEIDQQKQMYEYSQMLPYLLLSQYQSYISGDYGAGGETKTKNDNNNLFQAIFGG